MSGSRSSPSAKFWKWTPLVVMSILFVMSFFSELRLIWKLLVAYFWIIVLHINVAIPINADTMRALMVIGANTFFFIVGYFLVLFWVTQFTLPLRTFPERRMAFRGLIRYTFMKWLHGPAIFVKEGKPKASDGELDDLHAGVAFVDLNSAIVLEKQQGSNDAVRHEVRFDSSLDELAEGKVSRPGFWVRTLKLAGLARNKLKIITVRTVGPGIVFTKRGEKIVGWADLRKQARTRLEVHGATRDGIEVTTNVTVGFTLGQPEEIIKVTKVDRHWSVVQPSSATEEDLKDNPSLRLGDLIIKLPSDHISDDDLKELDRVFSQGDIKWLEHGSTVVEKKDGIVAPYIFDGDRVFNAVYSRARQAKDGPVLDWTELPARVAAESFRSLLAHENYDDLYLPDDPKKYPLTDFKGKFGRIVRNMGILGYQFVKRKDGGQLIEKQAWKEDEMIFSAPGRFQESAVLRDRGIRVLFASFSELVPANDIVRAQLLENWRANWQQETEKTLGDHELRTIRVHNRERSRTQQDMIYTLFRIFKENNYTDEALAIRLYQALEMAATNPATQRLLPADTIQMLSNLRQWLLPDDKSTNKPADGVVISVDKSP